MFPERVVRLLNCKGGRDCQDDGWLSLRGHWHCDNQDYRKRWDGACSRGGPICPRGTTQSNIHRGSWRRKMPDTSATRHRHNYQRRQDNPGRREVWRVIQAKEKTLSLRWSFKDNLERELITGWSFKVNLQRDVNRIKVLQEGERVHSDEVRDGPSHDSTSDKGLGERRQELKASWYGYK